MSHQSKSLTVGAFARAAGVSVETIRFYQIRELLPTPDRPYGGVRHYGLSDVARVKFIKAAQRLGFSLSEIGQLLRLEDGTHCSEARELALQRLADVRMRLLDLTRIEAALSKLVSECRAREGRVSCPLISALYAH